MKLPLRMELRKNNTSTSSIRECAATDCAAPYEYIQGSVRNKFQPPSNLLLRLSIICIVAEMCGHGALRIATLPSFMPEFALPRCCSGIVNARPPFVEAADSLAQLYTGQSVRFLGEREIGFNSFAIGPGGNVAEGRLKQDKETKHRGKTKQSLLSRGKRKTDYSGSLEEGKIYRSKLPNSKEFSRKRRDRENRLRERVHELLADSSEFRKVQAEKMEKHVLNAYAAESGMVDPERSQAWKQATSKFKTLKNQLHYLDLGAAAGSAFAVTSLLGLLLNKRKKEFLPASEKRQRVLGSAGLRALGILGSVALGLGLLARRRKKRKLKAAENRLLRMENEAFAGLLPRETPVLGLEEYSEEEKNRRKREQKRQLEKQK